MNREEIREKAKKLLGNASIDVLSDDEKTIKILKDIINSNNEDTKFNEETLKCIERYILAKQKMQTNEKNNEFMHNLAEELRSQKVRKDDDVLLNIPLFKITTKDNNKEYYFITRKNAQKFADANKKYIKNSEVMQIEENKNLELEKLIKIIKEEF